MSDKINDGGPAFPMPSLSQDQSTNVTTIHQGDGGMTLRDYFAAQAMQAYLPIGSQAVHENGMVRVSTQSGEAIAELAYYVADAMLKARGGPQ